MAWDFLSRKGKCKATMALIFFVFAIPALAHGVRPYHISWFTIDGSGGISSGGW
jgi:hypothetical protein